MIHDPMIDSREGDDLVEARTKEITSATFDPGPRNQDGRFLATGTAPNANSRIQSRTYDAIVSPEGGGDFSTIEDAVDYVMKLGGGDIFVRAGTYKPARSISITKPLMIQGASASLVTIDFNSTSRNFSISSTNIYTTGTITSITAGINVTGSGTSWLANVQAGYQLFLGTRWYSIAAVTSDTTLILAEAYFDNVTLPSTYRIAKLCTDVQFENLTIKSSTGTGITATDVRAFIMTGVILALNNKALTLTNAYIVIIHGSVAAASTSNGVEFTNCGLLDCAYFASDGNGGHGVLLNTVKIASFQFCESSSNTSSGDGYNLTSCTTIQFTTSMSSNAGQGAELVASNTNIIFTGCYAASNTSDGIKITASSNYCKVFGNHFDTNGGWGVNIAAASCNKNVVTSNSFNTNASGTVNDSGTGDITASNTA